MPECTPTGVQDSVSAENNATHGLRTARQHDGISYRTICVCTIKLGMEFAANESEIFALVDSNLEFDCCVLVDR